MSTPQQLKAASSLPPRLIRFFQKYPPPALFPNLTTTISTPTSPSAPSATPQDASTIISTTPPSDPNATTAELSTPDLPPIPSTAPQASRIPAHAHDLPYPNPFLPHKNFTTGRWHGPTFGLRKQADLVKLAVAHDVVDLLPWTIKKPGEKEARRIESGLMVKGTGIGQKVKGKMWERTLKGRLEMRRQAMLNMPALIQEWKQVSFLGGEEGVIYGMCANNCLEGTWTRVEEVAEREGEEVDGCWWEIWNSMWVWISVQWSSQHLQEALGHTFFTHGSVREDSVYCTYTYDMRKIQFIASNVPSAVFYDRVGGGYPACLLNSNLLCKLPNLDATL
jgi:large subunit ribosomal protein L25